MYVQSRGRKSMTQSKKAKLFIFLAISVIVILFIISIAQIVSLNNKERELQAQQAEIDRLNDALDYYDNQNQGSDSDPDNDDAYDDKNPDIVIDGPGGE